MNRSVYLLITLVLSLFPAIASAQTAAAPTINCESARKPEVDYKTYWDTCTARARTARAGSRVTAAAGATVYDVRTTMSALSFANVPTWSDADILAQFPLQRDVRYMTGTNNPGVQRRISWLYPDDGCFSRAEQFNVRVAAAGKVKPYKLFAFGDPLRVYTTNAPSGVIYWGWHVVPVVKNSAGEPIVFDAALSPCRPLPWKRWLELMTDALSNFDAPSSNFSVSLGDANAYFPLSLASGEPSHAAESLTHQTGTYLNLEWTRQVQLGRDPNVVFGNSPPWSGYACVQPHSETVFATVAAGATKTLTASCPIATVVVGGGHGIPPGFLVSKNVKSGNGWQMTVRNTTGSSSSIAVKAICLTGAPSNAQVSSIQGNVVNVSPGSWATSTASCGSGTLIAGGYSTTQGSTIMRVYTNNRSTNTGSTWQASAYNTTGSQKSITAFAYCLPSTSFTFNQTSTTVDGSGYAVVFCDPKQVLGGGFSFPRTANYTPIDQFPYGTGMYVTTLSGVPSSGDANARGYAQCIAHP